MYQCSPVVETTTATTNPTTVTDSTTVVPTTSVTTSIQMSTTTTSTTSIPTTESTTQGTTTVTNGPTPMPFTTTTTSQVTTGALWYMQIFQTCYNPYISANIMAIILCHCRPRMWGQTGWMRRVVWRWLLRKQHRSDERLLQENLRILLQSSWRYTVALLKIFTHN